MTLPRIGLWSFQFDGLPWSEGREVAQELAAVVERTWRDRWQRRGTNRAKVADGIRSACKGRPVSEEMVDELAEAVEDDVRLEAAAGNDITSSVVGHAVLERLKGVDEVAYMRFASVYKNFDDAADFRRELALLQKRSTRA